MKPIYSIIIPTYRRPDLLRQAIQSCINQKTTIPFEIVVTDNDDDRSSSAEDVVQEFNDDRIHYSRNESNLGMFGNWNRAVEKSNCDWIVLLHDDDLLLPDYLDEVHACRLKFPRATLIVPLSEAIGTDAKQIPVKTNILVRGIRNLRSYFQTAKKYKHIHKSIYLFAYPHASPGWLFSRNCWSAAGGFAEKWHPIADYTTSYDLVNHGQGVKIFKKLFQYRWQDNATLRLEIRKEILSKSYQFRRTFLDGKRILFQPYIQRALNRVTAQQINRMLYELSPDQKENFYKDLCGDAYYTKYLGEHPGLSVRISLLLYNLSPTT